MSTPIDTLPQVITEYLAAHQARDLDPAVAGYTEDAVVVDEGKTYRGKQEIRDWLGRAGGEYTYTTELIATQRVDDEHYVAVHHLEGNFPGGVVDLRFRFTLRDGRIAELVIEP
ncbi:nuclear transport factor 2 family protein [Kutzneria buriramensis]|uniref:Ketosteroid isomerase-like protein n=1 Tax=Kutzneria buriramensis TaxID=1045776 RepID=A0A3E0HIV8_9PSEU|nr:nuclear transport factor 2 family protein [Kutzneria buriramensis]REH45995.1 ketosteroid isomerase-like protein [Kutzneria buriramensis]